MMNFLDLIKGIAMPADNKSCRIESISRDSRNISAGTCFVACHGNKYDGNNFINDAIKKGAVAILTEENVLVPKGVCHAIVKDCMEAWGELSARWFDDPSTSLKVVGVTGTNGKTTTTYLLESIFEKADLKPGVIGTVEYRFENFVLQADRTTPDAYILQELLRKMRDSGVKAVAMEVSSHAIDQKRIAGCKFAGAIFTNLSPEHLDYHNGMEEYFAAKARLFEQELVKSKSAFAVVNSDDSYGKRLMSPPDHVDLYSYGFEKPARLHAEHLILKQDGLEMRVKFDGASIDVRSNLVGRFNAYNILASLAAAVAIGVPIEAALSGIMSVKRIPGRAETVKNGRGVLALVDYAHTPDALQNILEQTRQMTKGRLIVVFGCGGDRDKAKRPLMGEVAARLADAVFITDDNPRTEDPSAIRDQVLKGAMRADAKKVVVVADRREAISSAVEFAKEGDAVVIAGKGHENYQEKNGVKTDFDDKKVLQEAFGQVLKK